MHWETKQFVWPASLWCSLYGCDLEPNPQHFQGTPLVSLSSNVSLRSLASSPLSPALHHILWFLLQTTWSHLYNFCLPSHYCCPKNFDLLPQDLCWFCWAALPSASTVTSASQFAWKSVLNWWQSSPFLSFGWTTRGGHSQVGPLLLIAAPLVVDPRVGVSSCPVSFSPILAPAPWDHLPNLWWHSRFCFHGKLKLKTASTHCFSLLVALWKLMCFSNSYFYLRFSHCLVSSSFPTICL